MTKQEMNELATHITDKYVETNKKHNIETYSPSQFADFYMYSFECILDSVFAYENKKEEIRSSGYRQL